MRPRGEAGPAAAERRPAAKRPGWTHHRWIRCLALVVLAALGTLGAAQETYYRLPGATAQASGGAVVLEAFGRTYTYVQGMGWIEPIDAPPPILVDGMVLGTLELVRALGVDVPILTDVRFGGDAAVRVVLELSGLDDVSELRRVAQRGALGEGDVLVLDLPEMLLPAAPIDPLLGVDVTLTPEPGSTRLELRAGISTYEVFALEGPARLVIDVVPQPVTAERVARIREVRPGVRYHRFVAPNGMGLSVVHAVEVEPGAGAVRVVGESRVPRAMDELASGAAIAINAGYFDPATFAAIGLLKVDWDLQSLPSRNRAAFAVTDTGLAIGRVSGRVDVRVDGVLAVADASEDTVRHVAGFGGLAGSPDRGIVVVVDGVVALNMVGPRQVPENGFALVYDPSVRPLAVADVGQRVEVDVQMRPPAFQSARYAVEAGPLLVAEARPAFDPAVEAFALGQRILDAYTQQAAVGIRADGTLLLVAAETMRAEDLIGVFLTLGAETAMRLDSGGSTALLIDGEPVNPAGRRRVVSAIVVRPGAEAGSPATR